MSPKKFFKFLYGYRKKLFISVLSLTSTCIGVFLFWLGTAAMGSGLSNVDDPSGMSYLLGKAIFIVLFLSSFLLPFVTIIGLFFYFRGNTNKFTYFCMFSTFSFIVLYFALSTIAGLVYSVFLLLNRV